MTVETREAVVDPEVCVACERTPAQLAWVREWVRDSVVSLAGFRMLGFVGARG